MNTSTETILVAIADEKIPVSVVRSARRSSSIEVTRSATLVARMPMRARDVDLHRMVAQNERWLANKLSSMREMVKEQPAAFADGARFWYLGERYPLAITDSADALRLERGIFYLSRAAQPYGSQTFTNWYMREARAVLPARVRDFAARFGVTHGPIRVTSARTRWGSCSGDGSLQFSWRLIMARVEVIDYVIAHELAHLRWRGHGVRFWKQVATYLPDYKARVRWLNDNAPKFGF